MEKFKTLNNRLCRDIIRNACCGCYRAVYMYLYNCHDMLDDDVYVRLCTIINELCPLTYDIYLTLPNEVQSYYSQLWLLK